MAPRFPEYKQNAFLSCMSIILCGMLLIGVLFSSFYIATEHDHNCQGEDCPICHTVALCENFMSQVGAGIAILAAVLFTALLLENVAHIFSVVLVSPTPVTRKIRLNN